MIRQWLTPPRQDEPELLDLGYGSQADVAASLTEIWHFNRYFGGLRALTTHLYPLLRSTTGTATIADLGTGAADIPLTIMRWSKANGIPVRVFGVDQSSRVIAEAQRSGVSLLCADAMRLPFAPNSIDFLISSLFVHHFAPEQLIPLLRDAFAIARRGIVMSDLTRGNVPLLLFKLGQPILARNHLTRRDGVISIRRGYTPDELRELAQAAGLSNARVYSHFPFRMTLVAEK